MPGQFDKSKKPDESGPAKMRETYDSSGMGEGLEPTGMTRRMNQIETEAVEILFSDAAEEPAVLDDGTKVVPGSMRWFVALAFEMDPDALDLEPSATAAAATRDGYSRMWFTATRLAEFLRRLGYHAIPMGNDTALSQPIAVDAGLGELSRAGTVITPRYGPRVRLAKVLTDLPLVADAPITFGVTEFCEICGDCAKRCPSGAISSGARSHDVGTFGNPGVLKWAADGNKCHQFWTEVGTSCHMCVRVCPFNKPTGRLQETTRALLGFRSRPIDPVDLNLDDLHGHGAGEELHEPGQNDD